MQASGDGKSMVRSRRRAARMEAIRPFVVRGLCLVLMLAGLATAYFFDLHHALSLKALATHRDMLLDLVASHPLLSGAAFMLLYAAVVALSFPAASGLTIFAGFLFGWIAGGTMVVIAATLGACILFVAARTVFGDVLRRRAGPFLGRFADGFQRNAFHYLLVLRLAPIFPFFIVNIAPAFFDVRLKTFAVTTFLGIMPATFIYAYLGSSLDDVISEAAAAGRPLKLKAFVTPELTLTLAGLALVAALPLIVQFVRDRRSRADEKKGG